MTFDPVPWFVGGGAQHSPEIARLLSYAATGGASGVIEIDDLRVAPLATPGGSVRVLPGACVIPNRASGGAQQSYMGRLPTEDSGIAIAPTDASGGRIDMVIARVEDPYMAGTPWQDPADPTVGPYIFTRVLPDVPSSAVTSPVAARQYLAAQGESAIALAAINMPASTSTVTDTEITSLREIPMPRRHRFVSTHTLSSGETDVLTATGVDGEPFPVAAINAWDSVDIPEWATEARVVATWAQVTQPPGNSAGWLWVSMGETADADRQLTDTVRYDTPNVSGYTRGTFILGDVLTVPASYRGTTRPVRMYGRVDSVAPDAEIQLDYGSAVVLDIEFLERPTEG